MLKFSILWPKRRLASYPLRGQVLLCSTLKKMLLNEIQKFSWQDYIRVSPTNTITIILTEPSNKTKGTAEKKNLVFYARGYNTLCCLCMCHHFDTRLVGKYRWREFPAVITGKYRPGKYSKFCQSGKYWEI